MRQKAILISIDGMRPDGFLQCNNPFIHELMKKDHIHWKEDKIYVLRCGYHKVNII